MKERLIICIVLFVIAYAICGCEEEPNKGSHEIYIFFDSNDFPGFIDRDNVTYIGIDKDGRAD